MVYNISIVLPCLIDKLTIETTLSYASIMGLRTDTNLTGGQYNWLGSMFYFGLSCFRHI